MKNKQTIQAEDNESYPDYKVHGECPPSIKDIPAQNSTCMQSQHNVFGLLDACEKVQADDIPCLLN